MRELFRYRDLIRELVVRDLKVRYRRSTIGFLWTMIHPLLTMLVLEAVFSTAFRFNLKDYPVYVFSGILFWNFFNQSVVSSMNSLRGNASLTEAAGSQSCVSNRDRPFRSGESALRASASDDHSARDRPSSE